MSTTTKMHPELEEEIRKLGWKPHRIRAWGRRVEGDATGVALEKDGVIRWYAGPFFCAHGGGQTAIRFN